MTLQQSKRLLSQRLLPLYGEREAMNISEWVTESLTGLKRTDRLMQKDRDLTEEEQLKWKNVENRLLMHEPVQYVLEEAWFCGLKLFVDKRVLIPRPETEELIEWIISHCRFPIGQLKILDIGSGSGSIAIALKKKLRKADVWSCDISEEALTVARKNAGSLGLAINFFQLDFLDPAARDTLGLFDIIVSNPPYVSPEEEESLAPNVRLFEPYAALFAPGSDPLIFYKTIARFGKTHLEKGGCIYVEIPENEGEAIQQVFPSSELKKDMQGKERMIRSC